MKCEPRIQLKASSGPPLINFIVYLYFLIDSISYAYSKFIIYLFIRSDVLRWMLKSPIQTIIAHQVIRPFYLASRVPSFDFFQTIISLFSLSLALSCASRCCLFPYRKFEEGIPLLVSIVWLWFSNKQRCIDVDRLLTNLNQTYWR